MLHLAHSWQIATIRAIPSQLRSLSVHQHSFNRKYLISLHFWKIGAVYMFRDQYVTVRNSYYNVPLNFKNFNATLMFV